MHLQHLGHPIANDVLYGGTAGPAVVIPPTAAAASESSAAAAAARAPPDAPSTAAGEGSKEADDSSRYAPRPKLSSDDAEAGATAADASVGTGAADAPGAPAGSVNVTRIGVGVVTGPEATAAWGGGNRDPLCGHCPHLEPQVLSTRTLSAALTLRPSTHAVMK